MVLDVCREYQKLESNDPSVARDLWIQALIYFRDLPTPNDGKYLGKALAIISSDRESSKEDVLNPLLVLEILKSKPKLKFGVIRDYLLKRLES